MAADAVRAGPSTRS